MQISNLTITSIHLTSTTPILHCTALHCISLRCGLYHITYILLLLYVYVSQKSVQILFFDLCERRKPSFPLPSPLRLKGRLRRTVRAEKTKQKTPILFPFPIFHVPCPLDSVKLPFHFSCRSLLLLFSFSIIFFHVPSSSSHFSPSHSLPRHQPTNKSTDTHSPSRPSRPPHERNRSSQPHRFFSF